MFECSLLNLDSYKLQQISMSVKQVWTVVMRMQAVLILMAATFAPVLMVILEMELSAAVCTALLGLVV